PPPPPFFHPHPGIPASVASRGLGDVYKRQYLDTGELLPPLPLAEVKRLLCAHVRELHDFYGQAKGYRIARKHVSWYLQEHAPDDQFRRTFNAIEDASEQLEALEAYFENFA
ncbi:hypothetical protein DZ694_28980, partial [Klebsiella pneumoniae]